MAEGQLTLRQMERDELERVASDALNELSVAERRIEGYRRFHRIESVREVRLIEVTIKRGDGVQEVLRTVTQWWLPGNRDDMSMKMIGENDPVDLGKEIAIRGGQGVRGDY